MKQNLSHAIPKTSAEVIPEVFLKLTNTPPEVVAAVFQEEPLPPITKDDIIGYSDTEDEPGESIDIKPYVKFLLATVDGFADRFHQGIHAAGKTRT